MKMKVFNIVSALFLWFFAYGLISIIIKDKAYIFTPFAIWLIAIGVTLFIQGEGVTFIAKGKKRIRKWTEKRRLGMRKLLTIVLIGLAVFAPCLILYLTTGLWVIPPDTNISEGKTIWYRRVGLSKPPFLYSTDTLTFIYSTDAVIIDLFETATLDGIKRDRAMVSELVIERLKTKNRIIAELPYSERLHLISTGGKKFKSY